MPEIDPPAMPSCSPDRVAAFAAFFRAHFTFVHQNLRRLGVPPAAVEDAAQEVFLVVLRRTDATVTSPRAWLFGIVRRIASRFRRGASRRERLLQALGRERVERPDDDAGLREREAAALLERFLARLDDDKRAVFVLAELEQQTAGEIASALGIKENTVYSRLRAARQEFERCLVRVRVGEQRAALGREALLARARRAHEPAPAVRERVLAGLLVPGIWAMSGETAAATSAPAGGSAALLSGTLAAPLAAAAAVLGALVAGPPLLEHVRGRAGEAATAVAMDDVPRDRFNAGEEEVGEARAPGLSVPASAVVLGARAGDVLGDRNEGGPRSAPAQAREDVRGDRSDDGVGSPAPDDGAASEDVREDRQAARTRPPRRAPAEQPALLKAGPAAPADGLARETGLMAEARRAIRAGAWGRALALLDAHAREFPGGILGDERRLSQILVTCASGKVDAGRAEVERLARERPGSALARKAAVLCSPESSTRTAAAGD